MKAIILSVLTLLCITHAYGEMQSITIAGTSIEMNIDGPFLWDIFSNIYYTTDGSWKMTTMRKKQNLKSCIQEYRSKLLPSDSFISDDEGYYSIDKYILFFHSKFIPSAMQYVLFIGDEKETVILHSEVNIKLFPEIPKRVIEAYKTCKMLNIMTDYGSAMLFTCKEPIPYNFLGFEGNSFYFTLPGSVNAIINFYGSRYRKDIGLQKVLLAEMTKGELLVSETEVTDESSSYEIWRLISRDTNYGFDRCQYAILMGDHLLRVDAHLDSLNAESQIAKLDSLVDGIRFREQTAIMGK